MRKTLLFFVVCFLLIGSEALAFSGAGSGTSGDPYVITDCSELQEMNDELNAYYELGNNVDCSSIANFLPIGSDSYFSGSLDGKSYKVTNLNINRPTISAGLIEELNYSGTVQNLGVEGNVTGGRYSGGIIGVLYDGTINNSYFIGSVNGGYDAGGLVGIFNAGTISNCYFSGTVTGSDRTGGLVGSTLNGGGLISNSHSSGTVTGNNRVGGLIGESNTSTVSSCYSTADVSGNNYVGGLIGTASTNVTITDCYSTGEVDSNGYTGGLVAVILNTVTITNSYSTSNVDGGSYTGGLVGSASQSSIERSYSTGTVSGSNRVGGLVGNNGGTISNSFSRSNVSGNNYVGGLAGNTYSGNISNAYARGDVSGSSYVGGLVGISSSVIEETYSSGVVNGTGSYVGGLIGRSTAFTNDSYWDSENSGQSSSWGGTSKTTAEMQQQTTFAGWDFATIWGINEGVTHPYFQFEGSASCLYHNVSGHAWSDNIGWISTNCADEGASFDYGIDIDDGTGLMSGHAWSDNLGWISFDSGSVIGCPSPPCQGLLDSVSRNVSGWARSCRIFQGGCSGALKSDTERGGWDGWISLRGTGYGVSLNTSASPDEFEGYAWGDNVVGWLSFNCSNTGTCATSNYKVTYQGSLIPSSSPPDALISACNPASCQVYQGDSLILVNGSTDPDGNNDIVLSQWFTKFQGEDNGSYVLQHFCNVAPALCDYSVNTSTFTHSNWYTAKLYVGDGEDLSDEDTKDFYVIKDLSADFECSLDEIIWTDCSTTIPVEGNTIYFRDNSSASEGGSVTSRTWSVNGTPFSSGNETYVSIVAIYPPMSITLETLDTNGRNDTALRVVSGIIPLPSWQEVTPF